MAKKLHAKLTDASCGGAATTNVTAPQMIGAEFVPPQLDAVTRSTDLVTVELGYNDQNWFAGLFSGCTAMTPADPAGHPCQNFPPVGSPDPEATADVIGEQVLATLEKVKKKAPDARVLLVGYPQLVPASGTCPELPLATGDYPYVRSMMELLDDELRKAADSADVTYVDVLGASDGHDICAGRQGVGQRRREPARRGHGLPPVRARPARGRRPRPGRPRRVSPGSAVATRWLVAVLLLAMPGPGRVPRGPRVPRWRAVRRAG